MSNETRDARPSEIDDIQATGPTPPAAAPAKQAYRKPGLRSGERLEKTTLASCLTGAQFCGEYALEA